MSFQLLNFLINFIGTPVLKPLNYKTLKTVKNIKLTNTGFSFLLGSPATSNAFSLQILFMENTTKEPQIFTNFENSETFYGSTFLSSKDTNQKVTKSKNF